MRCPLMKTQPIGPFGGGLLVIVPMPLGLTPEGADHRLASKPLENAMATTYRAAYYIGKGNSAGVVLTPPEMADQSDDTLRAEAFAEAMRAGLIGPDAEAGQVSEAHFFDGLHVGNWTD